MRPEAPIRIVDTAPVRVYEFPHGSCVFLLPERVNWVKTTSTGRWIYGELQRRPRSVEELAADVADHYRVPADVVAGPIRALVDELCLNGLAAADGQTAGAGAELISLDSLSLQEVWFNVTGACNLHCPFCYVPGTGPKATHMPLDLATRAIDEAAAMGVCQMVFAGGEPTLHPQLAEIIGYARNKGALRLKLVTNGSRDSRDYWTDLLPLLDDIQVSVDGTDAATHDRLRGPGSFKHIVGLFKILNEDARAGMRRGISFTPLPENVDQIPQLFKLALILGANYIHLNRPKNPGNPERARYDSGAAPTDQGFFQAALKQYDKLLLNIMRDKEYNTGFLGRPDPHLDTSFDPSSELFSRVKKTRCAAGILTVCVDQNGRCYPCAALCQEEHASGDLTRERLADVYARLRRSMETAFHVDSDPECGGCDFRYFCGGGCRAVNCGLSERDRACSVLRERFLASLGAITRVKNLGGEAPQAADQKEKPTRSEAVSEVFCG